MKRPSARTMFLGHPMVSLPLTLGGLGGLYAGYQAGSNATPFALLSIVVLAAVGKATADATAFRNWQREWDAMSGEAPPPSKLKGCFGTVLAACLVLRGLALAAANPSTTGNLLVTVGGPLVALIAVCLWLRSRRHRSAHSQKEVPVEVVAKPSKPAPTLDAAYADLPEHLKHLMKRSGQ